MTETAPNSQTEKRRGIRFPVIVPVEAKWQEASGKNIKETANAVEVNAQGGLLEMKVYPSVGSHLDLTNLLSGESFRARVVGTRRSADVHVRVVAVMLMIYCENLLCVNIWELERSDLLKRLNLMSQIDNQEADIIIENLEYLHF